MTASENTQEQTVTTTSIDAGSEATLTVSGKVIAVSGGRIVIEYLAGNGFPDRIAVDTASTAVTVQPAAAPSPAEQQRRDRIHALIRDSHLA